MSTLDDTQRQRQYDRSQELVQAIKLLTLMPDEIRSILGEGILTMMQREFEELMEEKHYRSLGSHKILSLHKTKNRRRAYDQNPILHKAISQLYILSEPTQDKMGKHILSLLNFIQQYFEDCTELEQELSMEDIAAITDRYIEKGSDDVKDFLKKLRDEFYHRIHGHAEADELEGSELLPENINSNKKGMRINKLEI